MFLRPLQELYKYLKYNSSLKDMNLDGFLDRNIKYFRGKHIPLAVFSVMFGLLLLPFALCLMFIQCLQKVSEYRAFSWVDHLKPFFDVYTGPFTSSGWSWTGLLLLFRCILYLIAAVNVTGDPNIALGTILIAIVILLLIAAHLPAGLYRRRCLNTLEYHHWSTLEFFRHCYLYLQSPLSSSHVYLWVWDSCSYWCHSPSFCKVEGGTH